MIVLSKGAVKLKRVLIKGLSQAELARRMGVSQQAISKWVVAGQQPCLAAVIEMEKMFGIPAAEWRQKSRSPEAQPVPHFAAKARKNTGTDD